MGNKSKSENPFNGSSKSINNSFGKSSKSINNSFGGSSKNITNSLGDLGNSATTIAIAVILFLIIGVVIYYGFPLLFKSQSYDAAASYMQSYAPPSYPPRMQSYPPRMQPYGYY